MIYIDVGGNFRPSFFLMLFPVLCRSLGKSI